MKTEKLYRFVEVTERLPNKFGMYICHILIIEDGLSFWPVSYVQFNTDTGLWTNPSVCGTSGEVIDWLELVDNIEIEK
jgi:hypothetical protein